eukprot:g23402.t1
MVLEKNVESKKHSRSCVERECCDYFHPAAFATENFLSHLLMMGALSTLDHLTWNLGLFPCEHRGQSSWDRAIAAVQRKASIRCSTTRE